MANLIPFNKQKSYLQLETLNQIQKLSIYPKDRFIAKLLIRKILTKLIRNENSKTT